MRKPSRVRRLISNKAGAWSEEKLQSKMVAAEEAGQNGKGWSHSSSHQPPDEPGSNKSCRLRSIRNDTRPDLERENFGEDEEDLIIKLHALLGNRWSLIAGRLPGRTDKEVENYWNSHLKGELVSSGIDPDNHRIHHTLPRPKNKNQIPVISNSDDSSTCATSAVSKPLKYQDQSYNKMHHLSNGTDNLELSLTCDTKAPDLCAELPIINP